MAENQGVNGDMWNDCAVRLFQLFGWEYIGDKNMDLSGNDDKEYGVDALMCHESPCISPLQACIIESKRYSKDSLSYSKVSDWISRLRAKLDALYQSPQIKDEFPRLNECSNIDVGIIICWVHDVTDEMYFKDTFANKYLSKIILNTGAKQDAYKRILVMTNDRIVRLCSIAEIIKDGDYKFVYPSQLINDRPRVKSKVLSEEYAMSNVILAEYEGNDKMEYVVFYFGPMTCQGIDMLHQTLLSYQMVAKEHPLIIYHFENDDMVRSVKNEADKVFEGVKLKFKRLNHLSFTQEPAIISNEDE